MQVVARPARKLIYRPGKTAIHYGEYLEEFGEEQFTVCIQWLADVREALFEPISLWMPDNLRRPGTSVYALAVEVATDYAGEVPEGFEVTELPPCQMLVLQGPPYDYREEGWAIETIMRVIQHFDPTPYGFEWADEEAPWFQLVPRAYHVRA